MKKVFRTISAMAVLGLSVSLYPISSYVLLRAPSGKMILLLGDVHAGYFTHHIDHLISCVRNTQLRSPLPVIIELDEAEVNQFDLVVPTIQKYVRAWGSPNSSVSLEYFEPRSKISSGLATIHSIINALINDVVSQKETVVYIKKEPMGSFSQDAFMDLKKRYKERNKKRPPNSQHNIPLVREYLADLERNAEVIKGICEKYKHDAAIFEIIQPMYNLYMSTYSTIKKDLAGSLDKKITDVFEAQFMACKTTTDLLAYCESWDEQYCWNVDYLFFDACLLDKILDSADDQTPSCVVVGESHALRVTRLVEDLPGWQVVSRSKVAQIHPLGCVPMEVPEFQGDLEKALNEVLKPLIARCTVCDKVGDIKVCSSCKELLYCSSECQKKDWPEHKKVCQKVKVKA